LLRRVRGFAIEAQEEKDGETHKGAEQDGEKDGAARKVCHGTRSNLRDGYRNFLST